ncbi:unnamed protein product, partial [Discosporangium mesarthrocarpum]
MDFRRLETRSLWNYVIEHDLDDIPDSATREELVHVCSRHAEGFRVDEDRVVEAFLAKWDMPGPVRRRGIGEGLPRKRLRSEYAPPPGALWGGTSPAPPGIEPWPHVDDDHGGGGHGSGAVIDNHQALDGDHMGGYQNLSC